MIRTFTLLLAATLLMVGLNLSGVTAIPWLVVLIPVAIPLLEWLALSVLAVGLVIVAWVFFGPVGGGQVRRWELVVEYRHPLGAYPSQVSRFWTRAGAVVHAGLWKAQGMGTNWRFLLTDRRTGVETEL